MLLLVFDVTDDLANLRVSIGKRAITFLPTEPSRKPPLTIDEIRAVSLHFLHKVRNRHAGFQPEKKMHMIRHALNGKEFLPLVSNDAGDVFVKFFFVLFSDE